MYQMHSAVTATDALVEVSVVHEGMVAFIACVCACGSFRAASLRTVLLPFR
jgi:hypothetical protein